jgi:TPR repeat protein
LHRGIGRTPNYSEALRLYAKAASRGSVAAQRMLQLIYARPAPQGGVDILWMQQLAQVDPGVVPSSAIVPDGVQIWQREPTPLYDLLPTFWQQLVGEVSRGG